MWPERKVIKSEVGIRLRPYSHYHIVWLKVCKPREGDGVLSVLWKERKAGSIKGHPCSGLNQSQTSGHAAFILNFPAYSHVLYVSVTLLIHSFNLHSPRRLTMVSILLCANESIFLFVTFLFRLLDCFY